jgi:hypothetical protein
MAQLNIKKTNDTNISTPPSGVQALFIGTDGVWYSKNENGDVAIVATGLTGPSGSSGSSGVNGTSGSAGTSGVNGNNGSSGTSGVNGTSGTSPVGSSSPIELLNTNQLVSASIGATANSQADFSIAIGYNADAKNGYNDADRSGIAIGKNSKSLGRETLAVGEGAHCAAGGGSLAIGNNTGGGGGIGDSSTGLGSFAAAGSGYSVGVGREARAAGNWTIALGAISYSYGAASIVIGGQAGMNTNVWSEGCILMGYGSLAEAQYSVGLGHQVKILSNNSVAIGYGSTASHTGSVVLGANNKSIVADHTHVNSLFITNVPVYSNNADALSGGLVVGQVFRQSNGTLMITH